MCPYRPVLALLSCGREMEKMTKLAYSHGNVAKGKRVFSGENSGAPGETRTPDPLLRRHSVTKIN